MTSSERFLAEFDQEMASTRKMLECVPAGQMAWKPHEKSMTLGKLANHVAAIPGIAAVILKRQGARPAEASTQPELLQAFDRNVADCRKELSGLSEERFGGDILVTPTVSKPLANVLRGRGLMNHLIHHRGQLSVYLCLDAAVPGMYGPSADEKT